MNTFLQKSVNVIEKLISMIKSIIFSKQRILKYVRDQKTNIIFIKRFYDANLIKIMIFLFFIKHLNVAFKHEKLKRGLLIIKNIINT